jgi:hypothetical protein
MARMFPPNIYSGCPSPGEIEIFSRLQSDPSTTNWIVLHSLDIADHIKQISGEIDFLIIIPKLGVLCLEVKAHRHIRCESGKWYYGNDTHFDCRSPFKQASEAMHSIRQRLISRAPQLKSIVFWSAVIFPYIEFSMKSPEWHSWQLIDSCIFRSKPISQPLKMVLYEARQFLLTKPNVKWFHPDHEEPDFSQCAEIAQILRPEFEYFESPQDRNTRLATEVKRYTEEQYCALEAMETNQRVVFSGPAGTGKTTLAIEAARRSKAAGRRVLFICYNRLLGKWLADQTQSLYPSVTTRTLHSHMLQVAGQTCTDDETKTPTFWENDLPNFAIDRLLGDETSTWSFDELVIDEAPDVLRSNYLEFLDLTLKGGLASGRWRLFGDFEKQAIYNSADISLSQLFTRIGEVPIYSLRANCRNTPRIAALVHLLAGLTPDYSRVLRPDNGIEPEFYYYKDRNHQTKLLSIIIDKFHKDGFMPHDIVLLSSLTDKNCLAASVGSDSFQHSLCAFSKASQNNIRYGSIFAFKGLEAPAIIVTDIDHLNNLEAQSLFYVAITRALHRLAILLGDGVQRDIMRILLGTSAGNGKKDKE